MRSQVTRRIIHRIQWQYPPLVVTILVIWRFNVWRWRTPQTLPDLIEQKRIALPDGDADASYLRFLAHYREALASPKRYFLSGFLMIIYGGSFPQYLLTY